MVDGRPADRPAGAAGVLSGVVGFPVAHSRSPAMMEAAFRALALDWRYLALPVPPCLFAETVPALPASGYRGVNVTIPHKEAALAVADSASAVAAAIGAANTLTFEAGAIAADNTDAGGLIDALGDAIPRGGRGLVLGAGGAARAAVWALREAGLGEVLVWSRTPERAQALAADLGATVTTKPVPVDLLVNSTSVGLDESLTEDDALAALGLVGLEPPAVIVELPYRTGGTPLGHWARRGGSRLVDGLEVLVRQGARSLTRWTGLAAPLADMRKGAEHR